jgi:hypothetical protein
LLFKFASEYAIRKNKENQVGLKLNRTHQLLVYAADVNLFWGNLNTMRNNTGTVIDASKEASTEVNSEKIRYMLYVVVTRMQ